MPQCSDLLHAARPSTSPARTKSRSSAMQGSKNSAVRCGVGIDCFPTATKHKEDIDLVRSDLAVQSGERLFGGNEGEIGVEHDQIVFSAQAKEFSASPAA